VATSPATTPSDDRTALATITERCAELAAAHALVREFGDILCHHGKHLEAWGAQGESRPVSELFGFAKGLGKTRPGRLHRQAHLALQLGGCRRSHQPHQDDQRQIYGRANPEDRQVRCVQISHAAEH
jgi:hypothetical protein